MFGYQNLAFEVNTFLPADLGSNGGLWLNADDVSTITESSDLVSQWDDLFVTGNNAVQGTGSEQPTITANQIGGRPAMVMAANDHFTVPDDATLDFDGGTGFAIFMVVDYDGYDNQGSGINVLLGKGAATFASDTYNLQTSSGNNIIFQSGNSEIIQNASGAINGSPHILAATMDNSGTNADMSVDGDIDTNSSATVGSDNASDLEIGGDSTTVRYAAGKYGEIVIINRKATNIERDDMNLYLSVKWGIALV